MTATNKHYSYYPGCSLQHSAHSYDASTKVVSEHFGITLVEVDDWNCCGATEYFTINSLPAYSLVARNLSLASQQNLADLVAPCSACYLNLHKTDDYMQQYPKLNKNVNQSLNTGGLSYKPGSIRVRHLLDVVVEDIGYERIHDQVVKLLTGLRVAPYYGCLIVRPNTGYNPEYPVHLDKLLTALGATVIDYPMKTHCCGGHMTQISEETAFELIRRLLHNAEEYMADMIVTVCPMCQLNLDAYQTDVNKHFGTNFNVPVLFFTQIMGLALGIEPNDLGIGSEIVAAEAALDKIGQEQESQKHKPKRRNKKALPMPSTLE